MTTTTTTTIATPNSEKKSRAAFARRPKSLAAVGEEDALVGSGDARVEEHEFKAETARLLDIVTNVCTRKRSVFELISSSVGVEKRTTQSNKKGMDGMGSRTQRKSRSLGLRYRRWRRKRKSGDVVVAVDEINY